MKRLSWFVLAVLLVVTPAIGWQHARYQFVRQAHAQDRQPTFYSGEAFHVVWFLELGADQELETSLRAFKAAVEAASGTAIYAGRAAGSALASEQIGSSAWDAVLIAQFPSRDAFDPSAVEAARAAFERSYAHGFVRSAPLNVAFPQILLAMRLFDLVSFQPSVFPLERDPQFEPAEASVQRARFEPLLEGGEDAIVIVNLLQEGDAAQQAADAAYGRQMLRGMAEGGYGPIHAGSAVTVEGDAQFDRVMVVYYPGVEFFIELTESAFFRGIIGDKQPGDTQAVPTVPILDRL